LSGDGIDDGQSFASPFLDVAPHAAGSILGVDLGGDGVTANHPGGVDQGPNDLQNYPVLSSAATTTGSVITGTLNSVPNTNFRIGFYSNTVGPDFRAGEEILGFTDVTTDANGDAMFTFVPPIPVPVGRFVTSTATRLEADIDGTLVAIETSEFSAG